MFCRMNVFLGLEEVGSKYGGLVVEKVPDSGPPVLMLMGLYGCKTGRCTSSTTKT